MNSRMISIHVHVTSQLGCELCEAPVCGPPILCWFLESRRTMAHAISECKETPQCRNAPLTSGSLRTAGAFFVDKMPVPGFHTFRMKWGQQWFLRIRSLPIPLMHTHTINPAHCRTCVSFDDPVLLVRPWESRRGTRNGLREPSVVRRPFSRLIGRSTDRRCIRYDNAIVSGSMDKDS